MRIAIVDDRREDREKLQTLVTEYFAQHSMVAEITCFASGDELLQNFQPGTFQCMFLDIYMEGMDGMDTARRIYHEDPACDLIFCTTSISHAVTSYEVRAAWYLTKPLSVQQLTTALDIVCKNLLHTNRSIRVHVRGNTLSLRLDEIYYMDSHDRKARIHLKARTLEVEEAVSDVMDLLSKDERFLPCNRNTMVNMDHIDRVEEDDFLLKNGAIVPLKQRGRAVLKKAYLAWTLKDLRKENRL